MNSVETRRHDMLKRVRNFGEVRTADFPDTSLGHELFAEVTAALKENWTPTRPIRRREPMQQLAAQRPKAQSAKN